MSEDNQTVEQDIKKAALEGVSGSTDERLKKLLKNKKPMVKELEVEIEIEQPEPMEDEEEQDDSTPKEKLDKAIAENAIGGHEYSDSYFKKHLIEGISSGDPGMMALGLDCLNEVIGLLTDEQRELVENSWEQYFKEDSEFTKLEDGDTSSRLKTIFKSEFVPLMMGKAKKKYENKEI